MDPCKPHEKYDCLVLMAVTARLQQPPLPQPSNQRQLSPALTALAGMFTDAPVSEPANGWAAAWRYQGLRL